MDNQSWKGDKHCLLFFRDLFSHFYRGLLDQFIGEPLTAEAVYQLLLQKD